LNVLALLCLGSSLATQAQAQAVTYTAELVGAIGIGLCIPESMNLRAQIAGRCYKDDVTRFIGFVTGARGKNIREVGSLGGTWSWAQGLNDKGVVVGEASVTGDLAKHAWVKLPDGPVQDLGTLGGLNSTASKVNNDGLIAGTSEVAGGVVHGFVIKPGARTMLDIGNLGGKALQIGDLSQSGTIVGGGTLKRGFPSYSAFYAKPPYTKLHVLQGRGEFGDDTILRAINKHGAMVGWTDNTEVHYRRAVVAQVGSKTLTELATPAGFDSTAWGINDQGLIVGGYGPNDFGEPRAFSCSGNCSDFVDLNTVTSGLPQDQTLLVAVRVNNQGFITAITDNRMYLLKPRKR